MRCAARFAIVAPLLLGTSVLADPTPAVPSDDPKPRDNWSLTAIMENDGSFLRLGHHTDMHYTAGNKLVFSYQPEWADQLNCLLTEALNPDTKFDATAAGFGVGQYIFTPQNKTIDPPDPTDRPYAGWLYASAFFQRSSTEGSTIDHIELDLGVTGKPSLAKNAQRMIHHAFGYDLPEAWGSQIPAEAGFNLVVVKQWKVDMLALGNGEVKSGSGRDALGLELLPYAGAIVGTVNREFDGGATLRLGWNLPNDFGPGRMNLPADATRLGTATKDWSVYGFVRAGGRAVQYNLFVDGSEFHKSPGVDSRPLVGEAQLGVTFQFLRIAQITYAQLLETDEFYHQKHTDGWGTLMFTFGWSF